VLETIDQVFEASEESYLAFIHLGDSLELALARVRACEPRVTDELVRRLIRPRPRGSWRETLLGLVLAALKGAERFGDAMLASLEEPRGLCLVPTGAALLVACERGYHYDPGRSKALDRQVFSGEIGYVLECLEHALGLGPPATVPLGPNDSQSFAEQSAFYRSLRADSASFRR
jgi:hypothetical protein